MENKDIENKKSTKMTPREMINQKSKGRNQKPPSSYSEMKKMIEGFESRFIMPSMQPELDGVFGVTLKDIATSLGVAHKDLRRKIETSGDLEFITSRNYLIRKILLIPAAGARTDSYVMEVRAAQFVVSSYNNLAGRTYLDYLLRTNEAFKFSLDEMQEQTKKIEHLEKENGKLRKLASKSSRKEAVRELTVSQAKEKSHLFGEVEVAKTVKKTFDEMTPAERNLYDLQQGIKRSLGIMKKCRERIELLPATEACLSLHCKTIIDSIKVIDKVVNKSDLPKVLVSNSNPKPQKLGNYIQHPIFNFEDEQPMYIN